MSAISPHTDVLGMERPAGTLDAATALQPYQGPWNERLAAHLLRRAGFGGSPEEVARLAGRTMNAAVDSLVRFPSTAGLPAVQPLFDPGAVVAQNGGVRAIRALGDMQRRTFFKELRMGEHRSIIALQRWWLERMLTTPAPLQEKMTLFYHGHFTTAAIEKGVTPVMVYNQNQLFRTFALGNLRELAWNVSIDPAMLLYLDNARNDKAHPNENYAREFMELFTLGVDHYTEEDVRQAARAWTGWKVDRLTNTAFFAPRQHDDGVKTFLGRTGNLGARDVVNVVFAQPQCAGFFASALLNAFVYNAPEPALVDAVAALIRKHDYEVLPVMSTLLRSNVFYSARAYRALVKSPVEFVIGAHKALGLTQLEPNAQRALAQSGQILFYPPNVAGWPGGQNWITSDTILARANFTAALVNSPLVKAPAWLQSLPPTALAQSEGLVRNILYGDASPYAAAQLADYLDGANSSALGMLSGENYDERVRGAAYLTMAMPAYQLN